MFKTLAILVLIIGTAVAQMEVPAHDQPEIGVPDHGQPDIEMPCWEVTVQDPVVSPPVAEPYQEVVLPVMQPAVIVEFGCDGCDVTTDGQPPETEPVIVIDENEPPVIDPRDETTDEPDAVSETVIDEYTVQKPEQKTSVSGAAYYSESQRKTKCQERIVIKSFDLINQTTTIVNRGSCTTNVTLWYAWYGQAEAKITDLTWLSIGQEKTIKTPGIIERTMVKLMGKDRTLKDQKVI